MMEISKPGTALAHYGIIYAKPLLSQLKLNTGTGLFKLQSQTRFKVKLP